MDRAEIKNTLSKRFCEISNQGIILGSGIAHTLYDNSLSGTVASNAREKICQDKALSSEIIGVLDSSFSAKGKAGIAFTIDAMFCNAFENSDTCFFIKYEDIGNLNYDNSDDDNVLLEIYRNKSSSYYTLNHPAFSKKKIMWFLEEAKELYRGINNDELDWDKL